MLRIGCDVGGTNTDAVVLDLSPVAGASPVLATAKSPTTPDVTDGIQRVIRLALDQSGVQDKSKISAVNIGTTHFVNALIERNTSRLDKVAVIRLCGVFSHLSPPFCGFPWALRKFMEGPHFFVKGGLQIDGSEIDSVDEDEIKAACEAIAAAGVSSVVVCGVYAPIDFTLHQEAIVGALVAKYLPAARVTLSHEVANIGLLERENASILNASLLRFASVTVASFQASTRALGLACPVFITSNSGTLLSCAQAAKLPIQTFSSGPTNSMRGAAFLARLGENADAARETALVVDIGGTTADVGVLLPSGFPRQAGSVHELCGVKLNFSMPLVESIGLGGGSIVRKDKATGRVHVGPESVGYKILSEALVFGGSTLTTTDVVVAAGGAPNVGDASAVASVDRELVTVAQAKMKTMLEGVIDAMKTSPGDVVVYLVGGGSIISPDTLKGVSAVKRFPFSDCANAVGACVAQVAGVVDSVEDCSSRKIPDVQKEVEARAVARAVAAGADPAKVSIIESEVIPVAYTAGKARFVVKAAGEWSGLDGATPGSSSEEKPVESAVTSTASKVASAVSKVLPSKPETFSDDADADPTKIDVEWTADTLRAYRPEVAGGIWTLSELDLQLIAHGCYILGCGGGGSTEHVYLALREMRRGGGKVRVCELSKLAPDDIVCWGGGTGSPEVSSERLMGTEYDEALIGLMDFLKIHGQVKGLGAMEIGGGNGMVSMVSSIKLDIPVLDLDFMGRAYPVGWQVTPNVHDPTNKGLRILPCCIASGDGSLMYMTKVKDHKGIDAALRAAIVTMGSHGGNARAPMPASFAAQCAVQNTISLAWRVGRAVFLANKTNAISRVGPILVDALGGPSSAKVLFRGKITGLERTLVKGHTVGAVTIAANDLADEADETAEKFSGWVKIPFKNENLYCEHTAPDGTTTVLATVPDLVMVIDAQNGAALGTQDFKYGLQVLVLGCTAAPAWTSTARGLELGDLRAFGYDDIPYVPLGKFVKPRSVIEEYGV